MELNYEIAIIGGGPGGLGAAVAAGRIVNAGIFADVVDRLEAMGGLDYSDPRFGDFDDEKYKIVCDRIVRDAGVDVIFHGVLFGAQIRDGKVESVAIAHNGGNFTVNAGVFIDATGDGVLAYLAGAEFINDGQQGDTMPLTTMFAVGGIDPERFPDRHWMEKRAARGVQDVPPLKCGRMGLYRIAPNGLAYFNAVRVPASGLEPMEMSRAAAEGRDQALDFVRWLRANIEGAEQAVLIKTGHIGIRETRRIKADYVMTADDAINYHPFDDSIACSGYDFDIHSNKSSGEGDRLEGLKPGECLRIPYRSLLPVGFDNLIVSCRAFGVDILPFGSLRVQPPMMCVGHAAGLAAALCDENDFRRLDVSLLRSKIVSQGGIVE